MLILAIQKYFSPIHLAVWCVVFQASIHGRTPTDSRYFCGGTASVHERSGYIDFGGGKTEQVARNRLYTYGLFYGKNFRLPWGLRLQVPLHLEYGRVKEAVIEDLEVVIEQKCAVITDVNLYSIFGLLGCRPMVQAPLRLTERTWAYCSAGAGMHYTIFTEECRQNNVSCDDKTQNVRMGTDDFDFLESDHHIAFSISGGAGIESLVGGKHLFSLQYAFIFWEPVNRETSRDLFILSPKKMHEVFLTHSFSLVYFFSR